MADRERNPGQGGADVWAQRLAKDPADRDAYLALHAHYRSVNDFPSLANLVAGLAAHSSDAPTSSRAYSEAGEIAERELGDEARAEGYYRKALARDARNLDASESLQGLLQRGARWTELSDLLEQLIEALARQKADPHLIGLLRYRLGEVLNKQFTHTDAALEQYRRAYEADPSLLRAMYEARVLLLARGDLRAVCALFEKEAAADPDVARKIALLRALADQYRVIEDFDGAVSALERACGLAPSDVSLTHALASELVQRSTRADDRMRALDLDRVGDLLCDIAQSVGPVEGRVFLAAALGHAPWHHRALLELERVSAPAQRAELARYWVAYLTHNPDGDLADERRIMLARAYQLAGQYQDAIYAVAPAAQRSNLEALALQDELHEQTARAEQTGTGAATREPLPIAAGAPTAAAAATELKEAALPPSRDRAVARAPDSSISAFEELSEANLLEVPNEPTPYGREAPTANPTGDSELVEPLDDAEASPDVSGDEPVSQDEMARWLEQLVTLQRAGKTEAALDVAERVLRADPLSPDAYTFAERHYRRNRDFARRAQLLIRSARRPELPLETRIQRVREAISLFESRLNDIDRAVASYRELIALQPENDDAVRSLTRLLERTKRWDELVVMLEHSLVTQSETALKIAILRRLTEIHRRERKAPEAATAALALLLDLDPEDRMARTALTDDLLALGRWNEATELIDRRIRDAASKAERVPLLRQLGELFEQRLNDSEAAFHTYERLLEVVPNDAAALDRMEAIDEVSGSHERLLATLERRLEAATPAQAANLLVRMATIAEADLLDQDRAVAYLEQATQRAPNNAQLSTALGNLYERAERFSELLSLLRERATAERSGKPRAELYRRMARILAQRLNDPAAAAETYGKVNEAGDDHEAWTFLAGRAREANDDGALAHALSRLAPLETTAPARRAALFERATLLPTLGRPADAVDPLVAILTELDPNDAQARSTLDALCASLGDQRGVARVLEAHLSRAEEPEEQVALASELSELYAAKLPDEARAVRALTIWAKAAPADPEPLRRLAAHYDKKRKHKELLDVLDALARVERTPDAQAQALERAAILAYARLKDEPGAFARLIEYVRSTRTPLSAALLDLTRRLGRVAEVSDLCEQEQRYDEFVLLLRERIAASIEPIEKVELYRRLAAGLIEHRSDDDGALAAYEGLLAVGDDVDALRFVQSWAIRHDDPERLAHTLLRLAHAEKNPEEQRDLLYERGRLLLTRLSRPQEAIGAFEEAASVDPSFAPALDELAAACESAGDHVRLAQTIERQLAHDGSSHDRLTLVRRLSELYEGPAADDKRAAAALARWAELDLVSPEPLRRLRRRQERSERPPELLKTLDALAEREPEESARIEAVVAAAVIAFERFGDAAGAFARLSPLVAAAEPTADAALFKVARASEREAELYDLLERADRYSDLVEQLEISARGESEPEDAAALLRRAARILHTELEDDERAEAVFTRLLAIGEDAEALRFMQARAIERGQPKALADALLRLSRLETDPPELRDLLFDYAHLLRTQLGQPKAAIPVLSRILTELDPEFEPALDALIAAAEVAGDAPVLASGLERLLQRETEPGTRADLAARLADLYSDRARNPGALALVLEIWAHDDPDNVVPQRRVRDLPSSQRNAPRLLHALDEIARLSDRRDERLDAERAAAELCANELQDPDAAFERALRLARLGLPWGEDLLRKFASQASKLTELTDYYAETGRYEDVVDLLRQRAEREVDTERRAELALSTARTLADRVGDEAGASAAYRGVLEIREDSEALMYLRGVAERAGDAPELERLLGRLAERANDVPARRELLLRRAELLANGLERPHAAVAILRNILEELDPGALQAASALVEIAGRVRDFAALSLGLTTKLSLARGPSERHAIAMRLADLYAGPLADSDRAALALKTACESEPDDLEAQRRLRVHLERQRAFTELVPTLDVLSRIEDTQPGRDAARLSAARVLFEQLDDAESALVRLSPLIHAADPEAERVAETVCRAQLGRELAAVYIMRAKQSTDPELMSSSWRKIAAIHEQWLDEPAEAFEASLRLLATDTDDRTILDEVDRLGKKTLAFPRLQSVYAKLVREAPEDSARISLLLRLASILENDARDPTAALQQLMAASKLDSEDGSLLLHVERLASEFGSHAELLWAKEQKAENAQGPAAAIHALLDVARTADLRLRDREQANTALRRTLPLLPGAPELQATIMQVAAELDAARPELGKEDAQRSLVRAHLALAEHAEEPRRTNLVLSAFRWVTEALGDAAGGFDVLRAGSSEPPISDALLEALETTASRLHRLDALNAHLARIAERAPQDQKRELLARRARILEERLRRYDQAAQAYERLLEMDPHDLVAEARHFACLKQAGRHRELLQALERRLQRSTEIERRTGLMREIARVWEVDLKNRASAVTVWSELHALLPHDEEAQAAIARLQGAAQ